MRFAVAAVLIAAISSPAHAQSVERPTGRFAGQTIGDWVCDPNGSTRTMQVCYALWLRHEEALLQQSYERLLAYARQQETRSPLFQGERGYVDSVTRGQAGWLERRNNECELGTIGEVSGSMRLLTYPSCQARPTAQRRERLDAVLARWQADFRNEEGAFAGVACALHAEAYPYCSERER
jgi:uncharacterized protein YecT (DUF1311 family)